MITLRTLQEIAHLRETVVVECKLAEGRDGKGALPHDLWETYSAFANTHGGVILLGVREKNHQFSLAHIGNPEKLKRDLFNTLNNPSKVSCNLLTDDHVQILEIDGHCILSITVP